MEVPGHRPGLRLGPAGHRAGLRRQRLSSTRQGGKDHHGRHARQGRQRLPLQGRAESHQGADRPGLEGTLDHRGRLRPGRQRPAVRERPGAGGRVLRLLQQPQVAGGLRRAHRRRPDRRQRR
ncbi:hypothetical protein SBRY_20542 [Actinacidiphila bryophytorum]|uniref:Uncharacterized protein n=1 Tax=Actinacidiphila bryophytorum TaxID=1436133 RepID=A0A9W4E6L8_9ACTN|nr:hypothetical protein SBRY_20542 [Actinacidiphila bryophytorum]